MKNLKEALISKKNIKNVDTQHRTIWWIITPSDEEIWSLSVELKANNCNSIPYHTNDGVTCFIVPEDKVKNLNLSKFNELGFSKTKKKIMFSEVVKVVIHSDYYANTTWNKYFNDNLDEALITKDTIKKAIKFQYYIIFPWGSHEQFLCKNAKDYDTKNIFHDGWTIFVMTKSELENTYNKKISLILQSFNDSSDVKYWVSNLPKNEIIDIIKETITATTKKAYEILDEKFEKCK